MLSQKSRYPCLCVSVYWPFKYNPLCVFISMSCVSPLLQFMAVICLMLGLLGPVNVVFERKNESQGMGWSKTNRKIESLQLGAGIIGLGWENFTATGVIIEITTCAFQPLQAMLLSDLKWSVMKLSFETTVPGPLFPLHLPISVALVSLPSNIRKTSLSFSVQKLENFSVIDLAPGILIVKVVFSLWS